MYRIVKKYEQNLRKRGKCHRVNFFAKAVSASPAVALFSTKEYIFAVMNKILALAGIFLSVFSAWSQDSEQTGFSFDRPVDEMNFEEDTVDKSDRIRVWNLTNDAAQQYFSLDTAHKNFYTFNPIYRESIANNYLGNLGSPYESMVYFDRPRDLQFGMADVYRAYLFLPEDFSFLNTKVPYTRLQYTSGGPKPQREESLQVLYSRNVNKDWNVTAFGNLLFGRGMYSDQATRHVNFSFLTNYVRPRYQLYFIASENNLKNQENGGITNDDFILFPDPNNGQVTDPRDVPTNFQDGTVSALYNTNVFLKHKYNLGYEREVEQENEDTVMYEFVPLTSIVHTFQLSNNIKSYTEKKAPVNSLYPDPLIMLNQAADRFATRNIYNEIGIYLNEGVNKYTVFGAGAYIGNELVRVENNPWHPYLPAIDTMGHAQAVAYYASNPPVMVMDSLTYEFARAYSPYHYSNTKVGAVLYKRKGENFLFDLKGEFFIEGYRATDYLLEGNVQLRFNALDSVYFKGSAELGGRTPYYYQNTYYSNYYWWDKDLKKVNNQRFSGEILWPGIRASVRFRLENIFEYVYFDTAGVLQQDPSVQVLGLDLKKDFILGNWHWDNIITYQASSSTSLALPDLALYTNVYYMKRLFQVLTLQVGFDLRYHTAYYAPEYIPAIGRFAVQQEKMIGNYPLMEAYANFHLKRMRFFVKAYHVNKGLFSNNYFSSLHYPSNPRMIKVGLSWNFYD